MSDSYQAIYDAVRSRISNGDVGDAVSRAASNAFDISHLIARAVEIQYIVKAEFEQVAFEMRRPFILLRPELYQDGNQWCALFGRDIQSGVAAFGETPEKAAIAFDLAWLNQQAGSVESRPAKAVS